MQKPNNKGELCIFICPECGFCSIGDPAWLQIAGQEMDLSCDNCCGEDESTSHKIVKFVEAK